MKALLLKDGFTLLRQLRFFLLLFVIFAVLPGFNSSAFAIVYVAFLPLSAMAYDERAKWDQLAAMMPYTPHQLVLSKYVLGYICVALVVLLSIIAQLIITAATGAALEMADLYGTLLCISLALMLQAIHLPLLFKFGVEKSRIVFFILAFLLACLFTALSVETLFTTTLQLRLILAVALVVTVAVNLLSISISTKFYAQQIT